MVQSAASAVTVPARGRVAGLDLIRGVAVGFVLLRHAFLSASGDGLGGAAGEVGVVMFFALSGYLITGVLVSDIRRYGRVRYGHFYRNRVLRLYPALLLFVAAVIVVSLTADLAHDKDALGRTVVTALTYTTNLPIDHGSHATDHLWTLATEEQFYIVWPVVLFLGLRYARLRLALASSAAGILVALGVTLIASQSDVASVYSLPTSWSIGMVIGAAARLEDDRVSRLFDQIGRGRVVIGSAGLLLVLAVLPEGKAAWGTYLFLGPIAALATIGVIFYVRDWAAAPSRAWMPVQGLGRISYAAYLWNYGIVVWIGGMGMPKRLGVVTLVLTVGAAIVSWYVVERPAARLKARLDRRARSAREPDPA